MTPRQLEALSLIQGRIEGYADGLEKFGGTRRNLPVDFAVCEQGGCPLNEEQSDDQLTEGPP